MTGTAVNGAGNYSFTVTVTDSLNNSSTAGFPFTIIAAPSITTGSPLPSATVGQAYSTQLQATGGVPPYTWSITSDTPDTGSWLSINPATGVLSGTPGTAETETLTVVATDSNAAPSAPTNFTLVVNSASQGQLFDFYVGPNGDDANAGTVASPWSITALGTLLNRSTSPTNTTGCKWPSYGGATGKRVGFLPGYYTQGKFNGAVTKLYDLGQNEVFANGPGCCILVQGSASAASPVYFGACDSTGRSFTSPVLPTVTIDGSLNGQGGGVQGSVPSYFSTLIGQTEDGTNGSTLPTFGNVVFDGIRFVGAGYFVGAFGNGIGGATWGNLVTFKNCELGFSYGFHDDNPALLFFDAVQYQVQNCWLHDGYSSDQTWQGQMNASFSGTTMTLNSIQFGSLAHIARTILVYGPGLPTGLTATLATGTLNSPGSTYTLNLTCPTVTQNCAFGWAGSIPAPWASNSLVSMNNANVTTGPSKWINNHVQRVGAHIQKTHPQTIDYEFSYFEFGNFATWTGLSGPAGTTNSGTNNLVWATPTGGTSTMNQIIIVGGFNGGNDFSTDKNTGTNNLTNITCYLPASNNFAGTPLFEIIANGTGGITNQSGLLFWSDGPGYTGSNGGMTATATGTTSTNNAFQAGFIFTAVAFGATSTLPQWQTSTGLEAGSVSLSATPFSTTPQAGVVSSFATKTPLGASTTALSSLGLPIGCSFAQTTALPAATVGTSYTTTLTGTGGSGNYSWTIIAASENFLGWLTGGQPVPPAGYPLTGGVIGPATPQAAGQDSIVVQRTDNSTGLSAYLTLPIVINQQ